jgi:hypothetical protein
MNQQQRRIKQTEISVLAQLPGDLFAFDSKVIDRAASFGLVSMQEGWIAGGVIAKLALSRLRSAGHESIRQMRPILPDGCTALNSPAEVIDSVDPHMSAKSLLRLRTDLVKRGLIT